MKKPKTSSMGPAFVQMSRIMDLCELKLQEMEKNYKVGNYMPIPIGGDKLGSAVEHITRNMDPTGDDVLDMVERLVKGWGVDASFVRQSFKFRGAEGDMIHCAHTNPNRDIIDFRLPFPHCTLVVDNPTFRAKHDGEEKDVKQVVLYMEERVLDQEYDDDWYANNGIKLGDRFISMVMGFLMDGLDLYLIPAEFHFTSHVPFEQINYTSGIPKGTPKFVADEMKGYCRCAFTSAVIWIMALNSPQVKHDVRQGLKPGVIHTPRRKERVFYEHTLLTIDPSKPIEQTDPLGSHSKHRLHPVRGFWRHYKSGKRTWVKAHWRGDKELGVVTHDYEIRHENSQAR
jgi:hypothetical protein